MTAPYQNPGDTTTSLRHVMTTNALTQRDVAELACVHVKTVESWLADPSSANFRRMHARHMLAVSHALPAFLKKRKAAQAAKKV